MATVAQAPRRCAAEACHGSRCSSGIIARRPAAAAGAHFRRPLLVTTKSVTCGASACATAAADHRPSCVDTNAIIQLEPERARHGRPQGNEPAGSDLTSLGAGSELLETLSVHLIDLGR
jgi:hypothetical protein